MSTNNLLDGYIDIDAFAVQAKRDQRTIRRWMNEPDGLPYTSMGNRILIHVPTARLWLEARMQNPVKKKRQRA
jgi:hypothetical protein